MDGFGVDSDSCKKPREPYLAGFMSRSFVPLASFGRGSWVISYVEGNRTGVSLGIAKARHMRCADVPRRIGHTSP